ncbi:MAG: diaminopimelate epimerase [Sandaracinaceae bacterium]|nr:diaminopimelate epimerase [Sandaracinaceae bacterium]
MGRTIAFEKYEGLGNDFVVVDRRRAELTTEEVIAICDRHRGIGADGVLFVEAEGEGHAMRVINADGSRAEMCGNGLRCVALHLARTCRLAVGQATTIGTDAGPHLVRVLSSEASTGRVEVAMRAASLRPEDVPLRAETPMIDAELRPLDVPVRVTAVSMGNPHAVLFDTTGAARFGLGPLIQNHASFPQKANVGFARMLEGVGHRAMELFVYERGAGWTEACGTGACAAAVAAVETGRATRGEAVEVRLPGGSLEIVVGAREERIRMTGPARHVFTGSLVLAD